MQAGTKQEQQQATPDVVEWRVGDVARWTDGIWHYRVRVALVMPHAVWVEWVEGGRTIVSTVTPDTLRPEGAAR